MSPAALVSDLSIHFFGILVYFGIALTLLVIFGHFVHQVQLSSVVLQLELEEQREAILVAEVELPDHFLCL